MTNPFGQPQAPAQQPANPFGQPQAPVAPTQPVSPFYAPTQQQAAPAPAYAPPQAAQAPSPQAVAQQYGTPSYTIGGTFTPPAPTTTGGGTGPDLKAMYGRLVLILPIKSETVPRNPKYITEEQRARGQVTEPRMTATFVVLDGSNPLPFGGDPYSMPPKAHTKSEPLPVVSPALWVSQTKLVEQCSDALAAVQAGRPGDGVVLGRLLKNGTEVNSAWILGEYTQDDAQRAQYYLDGVKSGQFPNPLA